MTGKEAQTSKSQRQRLSVCLYIFAAFMFYSLVQAMPRDSDLAGFPRKINPFPPM
jgi:hypothetical protein